MKYIISIIRMNKNEIDLRAIEYVYSDHGKFKIDQVISMIDEGHEFYSANAKDVKIQKVVDGDQVYIKSAEKQDGKDNLLFLQRI